MGHNLLNRNILRKHPATILLLAILLCAAVAISVFAQQGQPPAGGVVAGTPRFQVVRSVSGTKGMQEGSRYVIQDPRTIFYIPDDKQVIVYFEWQGPPGTHNFEGYWKNPEGKVIAISDFKFEATDKLFGGFWSFLLVEQMPTGLWSLEARIDGETAGVHTFQIVASARPAEATAPVRRVLTTSEIYQKAMAATVSIEKLGPQGEKLDVGSGFILGYNQVVTAFEVIDGATALRVTLADGTKLSTTQVLNWNRWEDWAILRVAGAPSRGLEPAEANSWSVGNRCFALDTAGQGNRVIVEGSITGKQSAPDTGERLNVAMLMETSATGSAVFDEYGKVVGIVAGTVLPGAGTLRGTRFEYLAYEMSERGLLRGGIAVPISRVKIPSTDSAWATLEDLWAKGEFVPPLLAVRHVAAGSLGRRLDKDSVMPRILDERVEFPRGERELAILVTWEPKDKVKSTTTIRLYDVQNRSLAQTKPSKISLQPGNRVHTTLKLPIGNLSPGIYRIDLVLGEQPAWRAFFRIAE